MLKRISFNIINDESGTVNLSKLSRELSRYQDINGEAPVIFVSRATMYDMSKEVVKLIPPHMVYKPFIYEEGFVAGTFEGYTIFYDNQLKYGDVLLKSEEDIN